MLTLYQAEWCPFSSAVREVLTELGIDFVARQVEPWPEQRAGLRERSGSDLTPVLETEDGRYFHGTRAIFGYLRDEEPWQYAEGNVLYEGDRAALCRCGGSANKPFCDGTHRTNGFTG